MTPRGPGASFAAHPALFAVSLAGAWGTALYATARAVRTAGWRRLAFVALAASTAAEGVGIVVARRSAAGEAQRAAHEDNGSFGGPAR